MTIDLYVTGGSIPSMAANLTAKHLGIQVNIKDLYLWKNEHKTPKWFDKINPYQTVPTIVDDGFILWESRAIMEYFVNKYAPDSNLYPKDPSARALVSRALYFDGTSLVPALTRNYVRSTKPLQGLEFLTPVTLEINSPSRLPLGFRLSSKQVVVRSSLKTCYEDSLNARRGLYGPMFYGNPKDPEKEESFMKQVKNLDTVYLAKDKYVAGSHVTLADFAILSSLSWVEAYTPFDFSEYPNVSDWLQTLKTELSSFEEVIEKPLKIFKAEFEAKYFPL